MDLHLFENSEQFNTFCDDTMFLHMEYDFWIEYV